MTDPSEPTGHTVDGTPWEEPRPPHLPDPVVAVSRRVPLASWVFLAIAAILVAWDLRGIVDAAVTPTWIASLAMGLIYTTAPALFGAALFARHPRAFASDPRIVFGIILLVVAALWPILETMFGDTLVSSDPDAFGGQSQLGLGLALLGGLLQVFGIVYVVRGLLDARSNDDDERARTRQLALLAIAVAGIVIELVLIGVAIRRGDIDTSAPTFVASSVVSIVVQSLLLLAWAYFVATSWNGAGAKEQPVAAWRAAAMGSALVLSSTLLVLAISVVFTVLRPTVDEGASWPVNIGYWIVGLASTLGYLAIFAAFAAGLPGVDDVVEDDEREPDDVSPEAGPGLVEAGSAN